MTTSGTTGLELSALLCNISPGDEVIMPSFTFTSTANAFQIFGAKVKFVDIRSDTCNIDENLVEAAITSRTKAIVPIDYAGVAHEADQINQIAAHYNLITVDDAAQGTNAFYKGRALGTLSDLNAYSFHDTKNFNAGEGGAFLTTNSEYALRAEILRDKGTNREQFVHGMVDKYTWVDYGSSYLPSELNMAWLYPQLEQMDQLTKQRLEIWQRYYDNLSDLMNRELISLPIIPEHCQHNAHMFYIKAQNFEQRVALSQYLSAKGIQSVFHYAPLHTSPHGRATTEFVGKDLWTTNTYERLLRLPMFNALTFAEVDTVCQIINEFYV
jgi:dTDP-4-amino-4,6-dideoxygalactose transaminase